MLNLRQRLSFNLLVIKCLKHFRGVGNKTFRILVVRLLAFRREGNFLKKLKTNCFKNRLSNSFENEKENLICHDQSENCT